VVWLLSLVTVELALTHKSVWKVHPSFRKFCMACISYIPEIPGMFCMPYKIWERLRAKGMTIPTFYWSQRFGCLANSPFAERAVNMSNLGLQECEAHMNDKLIP